MKVAIYNPVSGKAVSIVSGGNPETVTYTLALQSNFWGFPSRVLDETPFEGEMTIAGLPILPVLDAHLREAGVEPRSFDPELDIHP